MGAFTTSAATIPYHNPDYGNIGIQQGLTSVAEYWFS